MRAYVLDAFGGNDHLTVREVPDPVAGPGQVLIRVRAVGIGIWDAMVRDGHWPAPLTLPLTPGFEGAGIVEAVGASVTELAVGEDVYTYGYAPPAGMWAERIALPAEQVARMPANLGYAGAAALPVAAITAHIGIENLAPRPGETVLVAGAGGGVGSAAVQLAKLRGARVIGTGGPANSQYVRSLGADDYVDYSQGEVAAQVRALVPDGVDAALDAVNANNAETSTVKAVRSGGRLVYLTGPQFRPADATISATFVAARPERALLATIAELVEQGKLHVAIERTYAFEEIPAALTQVEGRHVRGKVVVEIA